nr:Uncharacterised protein [Klebsiella pneumoniae]
MTPKGLPTVVSERLVGFGHTVNVFTFLNCSTFVVCSISEFVRRAQSHGFITAFTSSFNDQRIAGHYDGPDELQLEPDK